MRRLLLLLVIVGGGVLQSTVVAVPGRGWRHPRRAAHPHRADRAPQRAGVGLPRRLRGGAAPGRRPGADSWACRRSPRGWPASPWGSWSGRFWVTNPLVQVPGLVLLTVTEGLGRFLLLQMFHYPAAFGELDAPRDPAPGPLQRVDRHLVHPGRGRLRADAEALVAVSPAPSNRREAWGRRVLAPRGGQLPSASSPGGPALVPPGARRRPHAGAVGEEPHPDPPGGGAPRHPLRPERPRAGGQPARLHPLADPARDGGPEQVLARLAVLLKIPLGELHGGAREGARRLDPPGAGAPRPVAGGRHHGGRAQARAARASSWRSSPSASIPPAPSRPTCWATCGR